MSQNPWDEFNKVLGPVILFICTPIFAISGLLVTLKELENGPLTSYKPLIGIIILVMLSLVFGIYTCNRSYGWFEKLFRGR